MCFVMFAGTVFNSYRGRRSQSCVCSLPITTSFFVYRSFFVYNDSDKGVIKQYKIKPRFSLNQKISSLHPSVRPNII